MRTLITALAALLTLAACTDSPPDLPDSYTWREVECKHLVSMFICEGASYADAEAECLAFEHGAAYCLR